MDLLYNKKIFKLLDKMNRNCNKTDLHSFTASTKNGTVFVDCRGYEIYIEHRYYDDDAKEHKEQWAGSLSVATNKLENLGVDLISIEI